MSKNKLFFTPEGTTAMKNLAERREILNRVLTYKFRSVSDQELGKLLAEAEAHPENKSVTLTIPCYQKAVSKPAYGIKGPVPEYTLKQMDERIIRQNAGFKDLEQRLAHPDTHLPGVHAGFQITSIEFREAAEGKGKNKKVQLVMNLSLEALEAGESSGISEDPVPEDASEDLELDEMPS
jgi:hypothetical protein